MKKLVIRKGIVRGETIVLENTTGLADGEEVLVGITMPGVDHEELAQELEAAQALAIIREMRRKGRSIEEP